MVADDLTMAGAAASATWRSGPSARWRPVVTYFRSATTGRAVERLLDELRVRIDPTSQLRLVRMRGRKALDLRTWPLPPPGKARENGLRRSAAAAGVELSSRQRAEAERRLKRWGVVGRIPARGAGCGPRGHRRCARPAPPTSRWSMPMPRSTRLTGYGARGAAGSGPAPPAGLGPRAGRPRQLRAALEQGESLPRAAAQLPQGRHRSSGTRCWCSRCATARSALSATSSAFYRDVSERERSACAARPALPSWLREDRLSGLCSRAYFEELLQHDWQERAARAATADAAGVRYR